MKAITVKYSNGKYERTSLNGCSAAQAEQIIKKITPELQAFAGEYIWTLNGTSGSYEVHEEYKDMQGSRQFFMGGKGKTPAIALKTCYAIKHVLKTRYGWEI